MTHSELLGLLEAQGFEKSRLKQSSARNVVWSRDASHFQIVPEATLRAQSISDVAELLKGASITKSTVTFRSGGSSLSGQTVGRGLVIDTRSSFGEIKNIGAASITAEPGVTLSRLNGHLAKNKQRLGPDPASMVASTLGGAVSNNSSGMTCGTKFNSYATILNAKIVFADGVILDTAPENADQLFSQLKPDVYQTLIAKRDQIRADPHLVKELRRLFSLKNTMGYNLIAFLDHDAPVDILLRLMVGSEGTLAFLGEIEMQTLPVKAAKQTNLLLFESLESANDQLLEIITFAPAAIELMDRTSLEALNGQKMLPDQVVERLATDSAAVLVEFEADNDQEIATSTASFLDKFSKELVFAAVTDSKTRNQLWSMRKGLYAVVAKSRPAGTTALLEDVAVPPEKLTTACMQLSELCQKFGYGKPVIFGHVRDGNIHFMISDRFEDEQRVLAFKDFTDQMVDIILALGGNLKAEHGTGRAMAPFVEAQFGKTLYSIMQEIKRVFDPAGILNPGVIFPSSETDYLENLKSTKAVSAVVDSCVECGYCESSCPSAGFTLTPRERIVAYRQLGEMSGKAKKELSKELLYQADQSCATDGMCAVNCPVGINTGTFVKELRTERADGLVGRLGLLAQANWGSIVKVAGVGLKLAAKVPRLATGASKLVAKLLPKGTFPQWGEHVQARGFSRAKLPSSSSKEYLYLPSCMNEMFGDPAINQILNIARDQGLAVEIPESISEFCCGTPFSSKGLSAAFKKQGLKNQKILAGHQGKTLIIDGSSCHQTLGETNSGQILELTEFVATRLLVVPVTKKHDRLILHPTCSGEKTGSNVFMRQIADHISHEVVIPVDWKCCGFAGDRGLLIPELTAHATAPEAQEVKSLEGLYVSNNQPCQTAMTGATAQPYESILEAWLKSVS